MHLNGHPTQRIAHVLNVSFEGIEGESLIFGLPGLAVSTGSACNSATQEPSYVLRALGRSDALAQGSVRFSLGKFSTTADVDYALRVVTEEVEATASAESRDTGLRAGSQVSEEIYNALVRELFLTAQTESSAASDRAGRG